jgi:hypothetical protein
VVCGARVVGVARALLLELYADDGVADDCVVEAGERGGCVLHRSHVHEGEGAPVARRAVAVQDDGGDGPVCCE